MRMKGIVQGAETLLNSVMHKYIGVSVTNHLAPMYWCYTNKPKNQRTFMIGLNCMVLQTLIYLAYSNTITFAIFAMSLHQCYWCNIKGSTTFL